MKHLILLLSILLSSLTSFSQCGGALTFDLSTPPALTEHTPPTQP